MKKVAIMQPYFLPYIGYFQLIYSSDCFVFLDDVNFIKKGWVNRNQMVVNGAAHMFTIPLQGASQNKKINIIHKYLYIICIRNYENLMLWLSIYDILILVITRNTTSINPFIMDIITHSEWTRN